MARASDHAERSIGPDFALEVWRRRKWIAVLVFVATLAAAATLAMSLPSLYRATATVLVERQQVSEAFVRPSVTAEFETRIQTIHKQVMSRARLSDVITRFGLYPEVRGVAPMDAIVERMRRDIEFALSGVEQTSGRTAAIAFTLSYSGRDPVKIAQVTNALVGFYVEENTKSRERQASRTAEFLKSQLQESKRELDALQARAGEFKMRHTGELPQQVEVNLAALDRLNTQLRLNGEYQIRAMERRERLEHQLADAASAPSSAVQPNNSAAQLTRLEDQLADLRRKFSDQYPDVVRLKAEIASLKSRAESPEANGHASGSESPATRSTEQTIAGIQNELQSLKDEERLLRQVIASYEARVENAPKRQEELQQVSRDYDTSKERYDTLLKRYEEAQLAENLEQGQDVEQFRLLDPAIPPTVPSAPNRLWLLGMGFAAAMALALGAVVAAEKLDTTFHNVDALRAFAGVPMLAVIRRIPTRSELRNRRLRIALVTASVIAALFLLVGGAHYVGSGNEQIVRMTSRGRG